MNIWTEAFAAGPAAVSQLISARTGTLVSSEWVATRLDEGMAHLWLAAPCKRREWLGPEVLPDVVAAVFGAMLSRQATNPDRIRTVQMGEYSQTWAGSEAGSDELFYPVERRVIAAEAGCGGPGLRSVAATVDPPITGFPHVIAELENTRFQPEVIRDAW